ncbi:SDR family NAD(P)-dependent oxidoreductase [Yinghuangia soli]|uniref:SDR family oxidoreductase n=1 Tax=Yinghuangia soli TaxID=2908204 RepID=A0AA41Q833_9ACTN|nr:SDR family NAD(P)-dependent oxidoreductase [Yinghuangia soli]MCF2533335.1 SDR family oxidoreductase [Yinghuangia soli]
MTDASRPDPRYPSLAGTVALVAGASGGIGAGIAATFAQAGAAVVVHGHRDRKAAERTAQLITDAGGDALVVTGDLADEQDCARLVGEAAAWRGRLDAVVNAAGIQPVQPLAAMTAADWDAVLRADATGAFVCTQAAARLMADQDGGGSITHIASIEGSQPAAGHAHYSSAKAALIMFARAAALEYGPRGVRVNTVSPGLIDRPGLADQWPEGVERWHRAAPLGRLGTPEDIGAACVFLASPGAAWLTGQDLVVDGGMSTHPTW